jgi:hypothetical protein
MFESNAATGLPSPGSDPLGGSATASLAPVRPGGHRSVGAGPARPGASTPGPHAPECRTDSDSTEPLAARTDGPQGAPARLPPVPGYDVIQFVGRGGMGVVYRAVHRPTGRTVALKLINPSGSDDPIARERFDREVRTLAALKHPNIVPVYDAGDWHGFPYCAMEFAPGGALGAHVERIRTDPVRAVRLVAKVARAVAAMHAAGVLHRDLKPLNVLLGADDEPLVADFGVARFVGSESDLTCTGLPVGTRQYMAPEQTQGRRGDYTTACDIWAIGVTLFEVLTGERPFTDDGETDVFHRIRCEDPPRCAAFAPDVPAALEAVARKCLQKHPDDRYPTAAAVADDLDNWLAGRPVTAPPVPLPPRTDAAPVFVLAEPERKARRWLLAVGAVLVLAVLAGGVAVGVRSERPPEPPKSPVERLTAGEELKLTDERGVPTGRWRAAAGHPLTQSLRKNPLYTMNEEAQE